MVLDMCLRVGWILENNPFVDIGRDRGPSKLFYFPPCNIKTGNLDWHGPKCPKRVLIA